jgi:hypothetical protein
VKHFLQKLIKMFRNFEIVNISRACQYKQSAGGIDNNIARYVNTPVPPSHWYYGVRVYIPLFNLNEFIIQ